MNSMHLLHAIGSVFRLTDPCLLSIWQWWSVAVACPANTTFQCQHGAQCIDVSLRCDGKRDCIGDSSDEENCTRSCASNEFRCNNSVPDSCFISPHLIRLIRTHSCLYSRLSTEESQLHWAADVAAKQSRSQPRRLRHLRCTSDGGSMKLTFSSCRKATVLTAVCDGAPSCCNVQLRRRTCFKCRAVHRIVNSLLIEYIFLEI